MPGPHPVDGDSLREEVWIRIRNVLMLHWDPIGVCDEPLAADEYENANVAVRLRIACFRWRLCSITEKSMASAMHAGYA
jgi:hypothetical protein